MAWPGGDDLMAERFGVSRSAPLYAGYVFVNGRYVDAPYVIEKTLKQTLRNSKGHTHCRRFRRVRVFCQEFILTEGNKENEEDQESLFPSLS